MLHYDTVSNKKSVFSSFGILLWWQSDTLRTNIILRNVYIGTVNKFVIFIIFKEIEFWGVMIFYPTLKCKMFFLTASKVRESHLGIVQENQSGHLKSPRGTALSQWRHQGEVYLFNFWQCSSSLILVNFSHCSPHICFLFAIYFSVLLSLLLY